MCLPGINGDNVLIEEEGFYNGLEYCMIMQKGLGHRCGYVKVLPDHKLHGKTLSEILDFDITVHGGLTLAIADEPCEKAGHDNGWWFGFDCAHANDAPDPEYVSKDYAHVRELLKSINHGVVRDANYVRDQCKHLVNQLTAIK